MNKIHDAIIVGAGPIGIAAAAQLLSRNLKPLVLEKGISVGSAILEWGHVRVFTPWPYVIDKAVATLLKKNGWTYPDKEQLPTGREIVDKYLTPAATTPELKTVITYSAEVTAISRENHSKHTSTNRDKALYTVHYKDASGNTHIQYAKAIIDASGTWSNPTPIGRDGLPVPGEIENRDLITYGIPDIIGTDKQKYRNKHTLILGAGHSAMNIALALINLQKSEADTRISWGMRKNDIEKLLGSGINDKVPARKELGIAAKNAIDSKLLELLPQIQIKQIKREGTELLVSLTSGGEDQEITVNRIIVATGFRPDLQMLREIRLDIDHIVEAPKALAPMIDPNLHSCGSVKAHGAEELSHHDENFYIAGIKSYGRAPTFLMLTGYEQVRSIADKLAGNYEAARSVKLNFPGSESNTCTQAQNSIDSERTTTSHCC
ncbi:NAD(P)-binding domain-containing protein [Microbulbifer sp. ZKSA006]|uniref:NAD(P)-binding domain-containing protein n=1 Tax=Microbulbifer sp. ZKSA006 TaxID=3243390 RepID=UPI0040393924